MVERKGVGGGIDGDDAPFDGKTAGKTALAGGRLVRLAAWDAKEDAKQQTGSQKNA